MRRWILELVPLAYTSVASAKAARCLCTSVMITHSSTCAGDVWSFRVGTLWDCTTLWWDSWKEMCISTYGWPPRISVPPWSFDTFSSSGCNELGELTSLWWGMRSTSYSNSCCSMSASNCTITCSISWEKPCPCDGSPCSPNASYSDESTTCMGATSSLYTWCVAWCIYFCYASFSCWHSYGSFQSFSLHSCNSFSASSILFLSLYLHAVRLLCYYLFS